MNTTAFPPLAQGPCPEFSADLLKVSQLPDPDFPEFGPGPTWHVSQADVARATRKNLAAVPLRNPAGRRLSAVWNDYKTKAARDRFAENNGWPFMLHLSYLNPEISTINP